MLTQKQSLDTIARALDEASGAFATTSDDVVDAIEALGDTKTLDDLVTAIDTTLLDGLAGAGAGAKTLADVVTALGDPATDAEITASLEAVLKSGADTAIDQLVRVAGTGLPTLGTDALGQDAYATIVTTPAGRVCSRIRIYCETKAAILSLNGGTDDHLSVQPGTPIQLDGLKIPAESEIKAKNADAGQDYANLSIVVW